MQTVIAISSLNNSVTYITRIMYGFAFRTYCRTYLAVTDTIAPKDSGFAAGRIESHRLDIGQRQIRHRFLTLSLQVIQISPARRQGDRIRMPRATAQLYPQSVSVPSDDILKQQHRIHPLRIGRHHRIQHRI